MNKHAHPTTLPAHVLRAIRSGPIPEVREWRHLKVRDMTLAEKIMAFGERHLKVPDGPKRGQKIEMALFQEVWLRAVFDNPVPTRNAILSIARRNGKTFLLAVIILAIICGPLQEENINVASAANSRDQAGIIFKQMTQVITHSPDIQPLVYMVPSAKMLKGLKMGTTYHAMSAEAKTGHGQSLKYVVLDESGQIKGPSNDYVEMLTTSQGSYDNPLFITISTQSPSDADYLSVMIDDATRADDPSIVCHVYESPKEFDLMDPEGMLSANPGLDIFRSRSDLEAQLQKAMRLPALAAGAENLLLNRRVAQENLFISPQVWKRNSAPPTPSLFNTQPTVLALDLSNRNDLTAAVLAAKDPETNNIHLLPYVFCPARGIEDRSRRDRAPYDAWVQQKLMYPIGGDSMDYDQITAFLSAEFKSKGIEPISVEFDQWRIDVFKKSAEAAGFCSLAVWNAVGQGYKSMSPRCETFLSLCLEGRINHGGHPLLTLGAAHAIATKDPAGSIKLDKAKATQRIDALVAAVMAVFPLASKTEASDITWWV